MDEAPATFRWRTLYPAFGVILVAAIVSVLFATIGDGLPKQHGDVYRTFFEAVPALEGETSARFMLMGPLAWAATAMVLATLLSAGIVVFAYVFLSVAFPRRRAVHGICVALATLAVGLLVWAVGPTDDETIQMVLQRLYGVQSEIPRPQFARITDALVVSNIALCILACCALSSPLGDDASDCLRRRNTYLTIIVNLGALSLSAAVVQVYWTFRLPGNMSLVGDQGIGPTGLDAIAGGLGILSGAVYSLILAGLYAPTTWVLNREVRELVRKERDETVAEEEQEWLKKRGLAVTGWQQFQHFAAILAPFVSGWGGVASVNVL